MTLRSVIAVVAALLIAAQVVRNAAVDALAQTSPATAAKIWSGHPAVELGSALTDIARATRAKHPVPPSAFERVGDAATKDPLASEPYLVRGVQAELAGNWSTAQRAFEAAQWRDPRSLPAAYFLAERYFHEGNVKGGLSQVAALTRLAPDGGAGAIPYIARYATDRANWPALRDLFATNPNLAQPVPVTLAGNIQTVPAALALSNPRDSTEQRWLPELVKTLVRAGDYAGARAAWARIAGGSAGGGPLIHDTGFRDSTSPPPFNWELTSSTVGLAERQRGGRLHVLFYGDEDGSLASQLLLLPSGSYRLSMQLIGDPARAHSLTWSLWCDKSAEPLASVTLDTAALRGWQFEVPAGCAAQWLKLSGTSTDMAQQIDVSVSGLALTKVSPRA